MKAHKPRPKRLHEKPVNIETCIVQENLPLPFVHYPNMYGTFFGFSETQDGRVYLCACVQPALENLLALTKIRSEGQYATATRMAPFDDWRFPPVIARLSQHCLDNPMNAATFRQSICHRCNLATPNLRWCHEMYGGPFKQHFGWYIEQTYLRLGVFAGGFGDDSVIV